MSSVSPRPRETLSAAAAPSPKNRLNPPPYYRDRKDHAGSGIAQIAHAVAHKYLVYNIVEA